MQEHERENETRCEIVGNVLRNEKNDEREVQNIESAEFNQEPCGVYSFCET